MATTGTLIIDLAADLLYDSTSVHWTRATLLSFLNEGQKQLVTVKPDAGATLSSVQLATGTQQAIPSDGVALLDIRRNMGTSGSTPGMVPGFIEMDWMNRAKPSWHTDTAAAAVVHWMLDPRDRKRFWVYPQQPSSNQGYLQLLYGKLPADLGAEGSNIGVGDEYRTALVDYLLFRAYARGGKTNNGAAATASYTRFLNALGVQEQGEVAHDPRTQIPSPKQSQGGA